jgi:predicted site-specific integrase-resolvase
MHKVLTELCKVVKELQVKDLSGIHIIGRDDDPWMILLILEVGVHLMVKQFREVSGVEDMITTSPDVVEDLESMSQSFSAKARHEYKMKKKDIDNFVQNHLNDDDNKIN